MMHLKILLPFQVFLDSGNVISLVAETYEGAFGILPHRRDCVAAIAPGILTFKTAVSEEHFVAVDQGVLVKTGTDILVSVRRAVKGVDLETLRGAVEKEFLALDEQAQQVRVVMAKLESNFVQRFSELHKK